MDEGVYKLVLNGLPFQEFIIFYAFAVLGALYSFMRSVKKAQKNDPSTPVTFSWKHFWIGARRTVATLIFLGVAIIFWDKASPIIFQSETPIELTGWSSFILGWAGDKFTKGATSDSQQATRLVKKVVKK